MALAGGMAYADEPATGDPTTPVTTTYTVDNVAIYNVDSTVTHLNTDYTNKYKVLICTTATSQSSDDIVAQARKMAASSELSNLQFFLMNAGDSSTDNAFSTKFAGMKSERLTVTDGAAFRDSTTTDDGYGEWFMAQKNGFEGGPNAGSTLPIPCVMLVDQAGTVCAVQKVNSLYPLIKTHFSIDASGALNSKVGIMGSTKTNTQQLLALVNAARASAATPAAALTWNPTLEKAAKLRAAEIAYKFEHTRPCGESYATAFETDFPTGENIAAGQATAEAVNTSWTNSSGHYANMINSSYKSMAAACYETDSGKKYWVELFSGGEATDPITCADVAETNIDIEIDNAAFTYFPLEATTLMLNETATIDTHVTLNAGTAEATTVQLNPRSFDWTPEDATVISVSEAGVVTGLKGGKTNLSVKPKQSKLTAVTAEFTVISDTPDEQLDFTFFAGNTSKRNATATLTFGGSLFKQAATTYNHDLAKLAVTLSEVANSESIGANGHLEQSATGTKNGTVTTRVNGVTGGDQKTAQSTYDTTAISESYIYDAFDKLGVAAEDVRVYYYKDGDGYTWQDGVYTSADANASEGGFGVCAYAMGKRKIIVDGVEHDLVIVMVRGMAANGEWNSTFNIANSGAQNDHQGMKEAEAQIMDSLRSFCSDMDATKTMMLVTGHSRGAGVANLLAGELDDKQDLVKTANLYAYTFGTPLVANKANMHATKYDNIFNIVNPEDFMARIAPAAWGYDRYGSDLILPSRSNTAPTAYASALAKCNGVFSAKFGTNAKYTPYRAGMFEVERLIDNLYAVAPTLSQFYKPITLGAMGNGQGEYVTVTPYEYFQKLASYFANTANADTLDALIASSTAAYAPFTTFFVATESLDVPAFDEQDRALQAHQGETYFSWMFAYDKDTALPFNNGYKELYVYGDADVLVYNSSSALVCKIADGAVDKTTMGTGLAAGVLDTGERVVYLPSTESYRFEIEGSEDASMQVMAFDGTEELLARTNVVQLPKSGGKYKGTVGTVLSSLSVTNASDVAVPTTVTSADDSTACEVTLEVEGPGSAWGGGVVFTGDMATVYAEPSDYSAFSGWYLDGKLQSTEPVYQFQADANTELTARFRKGYDFEAKKPRVKVSKIQSQTYTGKALEGKPVVTVGNVTLEEGLDYELDYANNVNVGYASVTVRGIGACTGEIGTGFAILPAKITEMKLSANVFNYTGGVVLPTIKSVKAGSFELSANDYYVEYSNAKSTEAGTYTVTVNAKGNFTGSKSATYTILPAPTQANPMGVATKTVKLKASKVAAKTQKVKRSKVFTVVNAKGSVSYALSKYVTKAAKGRIKISSGGKLTVKKGTPKGTYKVKVKVTASGDKGYAPATKTVRVKVVVK